MAKFLKQTGESGYFDIRLTTDEASALLEALDHGTRWRLENPQKIHPDLSVATEKIMRGWIIMARDQNNALI